jgi:hypothetical protein
MAVTFHKVKTSLETKIRKAGGKSIASAVTDARENLAGLADTHLALMAERLDALVALVEPYSDRPTDDGLDQIHGIADECMGYCAGVERTGLSECFLKICQLADAVSLSTLWLPRCFEPLVNMTRLSLAGVLDNRQIEVLSGEINRCIDRLSAARKQPGRSQ